MTIYVWTDGDYSDYRIIGVFTDKIAAEKAVKAANMGQIEEFEDGEKCKDGRLKFSVYVKTEDTKETTSVNFNTYKQNLNEVEFYEKANTQLYDEYRGYKKGYYSCYSVAVMAEDKEHAVKIASDLIAQYKAVNNK